MTPLYYGSSEVNRAYYGSTEVGLFSGANAIIPSWAIGSDLWEDFTQNFGSLPTPTDTHAQTIYAPNAAGVYTPFSANTLVRTDLGLQTVPTRTNTVRNNSMEGASASPNTFPTNWGSANGSGITRDVVSIGEENGVPYIDIRMYGTFSTPSGYQLGYDTVTAIDALNGETWAASAFMAIVGGSTANIDGLYACSIAERTAAGSFVLNNNGTDIKSSISSELTRYENIATLSGGGTVAKVQPRFNIAAANGAEIDLTIRFGAPQLEKAAFVSSLILTTSAAVPVNGNQQVISGLGAQLATGVAGLVQWNQNAIDLTSGILNRILHFSDGTASNVLSFRTDGGTALVQDIFTSSVSQGSVTGANGTHSVGQKTVAFIWTGNYFRWRLVGGSDISPDTTSTYPSGLDRVSFGGIGMDTSRNNYQYTRKLAFDFLAPGDDPATKFAEWYAKALLA